MNNRSVNSRDSVSRIRDSLRLEFKKYKANMMIDFGPIVCMAMRLKELGYGA
jgi:hypothetical protein